ncbi:RND transporter, partial [Streptomyces sp. SID10244]|nr:RND transporter [Streptomyces sp. SID10244]
DTALGRDHRSDVILLITPPAGTKVDDPQFGAKVENFVDDLISQHGDVVNREDPGLIDPFYLRDQSATSKAAQDTIRARTFSPDKTHAFISIGVKGDDDTTVLQNYKTIQPSFDNIPERFNLEGTNFELAGLQPVAGSMADGMD